MFFDLLDIVIVIAAACITYSGWRRGITWVGPSLVGLVIGIVIGALIAPPLARWITSNPEFRPTVTTSVFFGCVLLAQGIGTAIGFRLRVATLRSQFAHWDSTVGATFAMIGTLAATWYIGLTFSNSPWTYLDSQIEGSGIVRTLVSFVPHQPPFLAKIESAISGGLPQAFAGLPHLGLPDVNIPATANTPGIQFAAQNTARVISYSNSCQGAEAGSAFAISADYMVTNAHVVAGGDRFEVDTPDTKVHRNVTVVLFDPNNDVAILHVPGLGLSPLTILKDDPESRTTGAVVGYPNGGVEQIAPAAVRGHEQAEGWNIYTTDTVTRDIVVIAGQVIPGNSGGPLVDNNGHVIGLVFATSTSRQGLEGYALSIPQITDDLTSGVTRKSATSTGGCTAE